MQTIYLDMDGTIADLYGYKNWLKYIEREDTTPYRECSPLGDIDKLRAVLAAIGANVKVISWAAKDDTMRYRRNVGSAKRRWVKNYLGKDVEVSVIQHGTPKTCYTNGTGGIAFDDDPDVIEDYKSHGIEAYQVSGIDDIVDILNDVAKTELEDARAREERRKR